MPYVLATEAVMTEETRKRTKAKLYGLLVGAIYKRDFRIILQHEYREFHTISEILLEHPQR